MIMTVKRDASKSTEKYTNQHMEFSRRYMNYGTDYEDDSLRYLRQHRCYC